MSIPTTQNLVAPKKISYIAVSFDSDAFVSNMDFLDPKELLACLHFSSLRLTCKNITNKLTAGRPSISSLHLDIVMYVSR